MPISNKALSMVRIERATDIARKHLKEQEIAKLVRLRKERLKKTHLDAHR